MTSKFDYTYVPMIDSNGESVKATASKAKREDEKDLREEIKLKEATSLYSTESKTEERVEESSDDETENEKLVNYLLKSDSDETDEDDIEPIDIFILEKISNSSKQEILNYLINKQIELYKLKKIIKKNEKDDNLLIEIKKELFEYKEKLKSTRRHNKKIKNDLKNFEKEYDFLKSKYQLKLNKFGINSNLIKLLAFKLIEFNSSPININEIKEISAALLDEVDRVNDFQNDEQIIFNENVNLDKMKFQWGKDREKRLFNLEGVIEVLRNRVDELERRILTKREDANAMEGFEYSHNSEGSDNSSQDDGEYGQGCESCNIESGKSLKDRLDDVEQQFDGIANRVDQVEKLGEK
ncbi:uncharacterized protein I206_100139 [Kwoniella pini CBS 10737]|uniref:Uncharacterized protein n=1 Tax=Kwoniella pini CBS 10737 TaxID=1296096 RepID=A0A1B9IEL6_9TREE|nr:uncharacterized protein I206_01188 [Kwoniella pini CBS 10737]OCF53881.1 hypothetical protein I206_01188 [Kwoniella pini CBS 10737]